MTSGAWPAGAYLEPGAGFDALKDAAALIRCTAAGDSEGIEAITSGTANPRRLAAMTAAIAAIICRRGGLDDAGITALLTGISAELGDLLLEQPRG